MRLVMRVAGLALAGAGLAGCFPTEGVVVRPGDGAQAPFCVAGVYGDLEGQPVAAASGVPEPRRIIRPGDAVTTDYNPSRTNIELDAQDVIARVYCG